jgi:hypothetical protein
VPDISAAAHSGAMLALAPTEEDRKRLALAGGEAAAELHLTLCFMGGDASVFDPATVQKIIGAAHLVAADLEPLTANIFGVAHWNGTADTAAWVWNVGDGAHAPMPGTYMDQPCLHDFHEAAETICMISDCEDLPDQYCPWSPHICAVYSKDLTLLRQLEKRLGPVTFDRLWVAIGDQDVYVPLGGEAVTAAGPLRRNVTPGEQASGVDFALMDRTWETAVSGTVDALAHELYSWRYALREQVLKAFADGDPGELGSLDLDTSVATKLLTERMTGLAEKAGQQMQREAESQGVTVPDWSLDEEVLTAALPGTSLIRSVAGVTASNLASRLISSAKRKASGLFGSRRSAEQVADAVSRDLNTLSTAGTKQAVGAAMSAAQNAGRMAVLSAAPPGVYLATEALDKNSCAPCRSVDGTEYHSLLSAREAYPAGGYSGCAGGSNCRGTLVAVWDSGLSASAQQPEEGTVPYEIKNDHPGCSGYAVVKQGTSQMHGCHDTRADAEAQMRALYANEPEASVTTEALKKGKPSKGTDKDKRLKENMYSEGPEHFHGDGAQSMAWDGSASRFTDAEYRQSAAACDSGGTAKESCFLPHHDPGGSLNRDGLGQAAGRVNQLSGHSPEAVARAKAHLRSHYRQIGQPVPDNLTATAEEIEAAGVEPGYEETTFVTEDGVEYLKGGLCGKGQKMGPGGKCVSAKVAAETEPLTTEAPADTEASGNTAPWRGPLTVEGIETGDGREFDSGALTWADLPLPLRWNKEDSHGGDPHTVAVNVGRIDKIWREDSGLIMGEGVLDLADDDGQKVHGKIKGQHLRGVSVDVDSIKDADMELVWPEQPEGAEDETDEFAKLFAKPEKVVFHKGRIRAATLVDIPAFAEAYIALLDEAGAVTAGGEPIGALRASFAPRSAALAVKAPSRAPADWFTNPDLSVPTPITVTEDGRVYGHAALWGTCHIGQAGVCVTPPQEDSHPYFMTGNVWTDNGESVPVGQVTVGTGHAGLNLDARKATEHYDNTGAAVADVSVGNDAHGIWIAGAVRPGTPDSRVHELRAAGQVSGDWRRIGGALRLVGLLAVNVPGFPVPKLRTYVTEGHQFALVASGLPHLTEQLTENELDQWAYRRVLEILSRDVHGEE